MSDTHIENSLVTAMQIVADTYTSKAGYDKTYKGIILQVVDKASGKYKVKYQDSQFQAYSTTSDVYYEEGQQVSFLVPTNDWDRTKTIVGGTKNYATNYVEIKHPTQLYNKIGPSSITEGGIFELCSYKEESKSIIDLLNIDQQIAKNYITKGNGLVIGMDVQTSLNSNQVNGNYGLKFDLVFRNIQTGSQNDTIPFQQGGAAVRSYVVSDRDVIGNPYSLIKATPVEHLFSIQDIDTTNFIKIKDISIYCNDFPQGEDGVEYPNDIFFSNIHINGVQVLSDTELDGYIVHIDYSETGQRLEKKSTGDTQEKIIKFQAFLKVKGKTVTSTEQMSYYWFRQNATVFRGHEKYSSYGGDGWECLNNFINNKPIPAESVIYFTDNGQGRKQNPLTIPATARNIPIKCVIVYENRTIQGLSNVINENVNNFYISSNQKQAGSNENKIDYYLDWGSPTLTCQSQEDEEGYPENYTFFWLVVPARGQGIKIEQIDSEEYNRIIEIKSRYDIAQEEIKKVPEADLNTYKGIKDEKGENYQDKVDAYEKIKNISYVNKNVYYNFPISSIINYSKIICTVYDNDNTYKGTASITLKNHTQIPSTYSLNIENSTQVFQYDKKGNSPTSPQLEKPLQIKPLSFTLIDAEGNEISYQQIINNGYVEWIIPVQNTLLISDDTENGQPLDDMVIIGTDRALAASLGYEINIYKASIQHGLTEHNLASFVYKIADTYDYKKVNNNVRLDVKYKDMLFTAYTDFTFPKDGDPGTNGTDYVAKLVPIKIIPPKEEQEEGKEEVINTDRLYIDSLGNRYTDDGNSFDKLKFQLYNNSNVVSNDVNFWTCPPKTSFDDDHADVNNAKHYINVDNEGIITRNSIDYDVFTDKAVNIVRAQNGSGKDIKYFAQYPICFSYLNNSGYRFKVRPKTGFKNVVYAQDGTSPDYDKTLPFEIIVEEYKGQQYFIEVDNGLSYNWNIVENSYLQIDTKLNENNNINITLNDWTSNNKCYFKPSDKFVSTDLFSAIVVTIKKDNIELGWIHIPIYMIINRYGHSALNDWDGTSIQMKQGGDIVLAPQVGAGTKDDNNRFTGVLIGDVKPKNSDKNQQGLFGYNQGQRSIFLDANTGSATFGKQGASQIKIDASSGQGTIQSGDYYEEYTKTSDKEIKTNKIYYIYNNNTYSKVDSPKEEDLKNYYQHSGTGMKIKFSSTGQGAEQGPYIRYGSGNFSVSSNGSIHASGSGDIAGWNINNEALYKNTDDTRTGMMSSRDPAFYAYIYAKDNNGNYITDSEGKKISVRNFYVNHDGFLFSKYGQIAKWSIDENALTDGYVGMGQGKTIAANTFLNQPNAITNARIWSGTGTGNADVTFAVDKNGKLWSRSAQIASWSVDKDKLQSGNMGMGSYNGKYNINAGTNKTYSTDNTPVFWSNNNFAVDTQGKLYSASGRIGGWHIDSDKLWAGNSGDNTSGIRLNSAGSMSGGKGFVSDGTGGSWSIADNGWATFDGITANNMKATGVDATNITTHNIIANDKGQIGGWTIGNDSLSANNITISSAGSISNGDDWTISSNGDAYFKNIYGTVKADKSLSSSSGGSGGSGTSWTMPGGGGAPSWNYENKTMKPTKIKVYNKLVLAQKKTTSDISAIKSVDTLSNCLSFDTTTITIPGQNITLTGTDSMGGPIFVSGYISEVSIEVPDISIVKDYYLVKQTFTNFGKTLVTGWHKDTSVQDMVVMANSDLESQETTQKE